MLILRPTATLARRLRRQPIASGLKSDTVLGDWYAKDLVLGRTPYILAACEHARLPILLKASPFESFPERLPAALAQVLAGIGARPTAIEEEIRRMSVIALARTDNRSLVGTLIDLKKDLQYLHGAGRLDLSDLIQLSVAFSDTVVLPLKDSFPRQAALRLLGSPEESEEMLRPLRLL